MRIVNLDKMLEQINPFKSIFDKYLYNSVEALGEACKVEAIPIGWIYLWRLKNMDKCPVDYIPFSALLNDWEKENGRADL